MGVEVSAQCLERGDVDLLDIGEMRDPARRLRHVLGNAPAHAHNLDRLDGFIGRPASPFRRRLWRADDIGVEVLVRDASRGSRA